MATRTPEDVTQLLIEWSNGDRDALDRLLPLVERELHRLAHHYMSRESAGRTLQTTELVNEAYLRLVDQKSVRWQNRAHFFAISAETMRRILVDHARRRNRRKRGGGALKVVLDDTAVVSPKPSANLVALDDALKKLATFDIRKARVVELRFFGGLNVEETAAVLGISPNTVIRDWTVARAWLYNAITGAT
jgi:RNA polymerase sigma factor (TIGR02999 family)